MSEASDIKLTPPPLKTKDPQAYAVALGMDALRLATTGTTLHFRPDEIMGEYMVLAIRAKEEAQQREAARLRKGRARS